MVGFDSAVVSLKQVGNPFLCYEGGNTVPLRRVLEPNRGDIAFMIGPEGGFSAREADLAAGSGIPLVNLGKRILRTETAALYVLSAISVLLE